jgi:integrase
MKCKLTKTSVERIQPEARDIIVWDTDLSGFFVKVTPKGRRAYGVYYRNAEGRERRPMLGAHGPSFTTEQARAKAEKWLARVALGEDPSGERQDLRQAATVSELADMYLAEHAKLRKKAASYAADKRNLDNHILPLIGTMKAANVEPADVARVLRAVAEGRTAKSEKVRPRVLRKVTGGKGAANRCLALLSFMLGRFAETKKLRPYGANPCRHMKKYRTAHSEKGRARFLSPREFARLGEAIENCRRNGTELPAILNAIELYAYTGCRRDEILTLQWQHVDFEAKCLRLPDSKTGEKIVPLGAPALKALSEITREPKNPYVIVGTQEGKHFVGIEKAWRRVRARASVTTWAADPDEKISGLVARLKEKLEREPTAKECMKAAKVATVTLPTALTDVCLHDLRRSFGSVGAKSGMSLLLIGKAMSHKSTKATEVYARLSDDATRQAIDEISSQVASLLRPGAASNVVDISGAAS